MAGEKIDLSKFLPDDATPEQKNQWLRQFYPTAADTAQPAVANNLSAQPDATPGMSVGPITVAPQRKPISFERHDPAVEAGHIQFPGQTPKGGDNPEAWRKFFLEKDQRDAETKKQNIANATFAPTPHPQSAGPSGAGITVIPGERTQAQWNITEGRPVSQDVLTEYNQADEEKKQAARESFDAGREKAAAQAGYLTELSNRQAEREKELRQQAADRAARMRGEQTRLDVMLDRVRKGEEDKGAFLIPGGAGEFVSALGVALGAAAAAFMGGGPNAGLMAANAQIEKQMKRQREKADAAKDAVDAQKTLIGSLRTQFGDENMAEQGAYLSYLERMKTEAQKIDVNALPKQAQAQYHDFIAGLDAQIADRHRLFEDAAADKVQRTDIMTQTRVLGGAAPAKQGDVHQYSEDLQKAGIPDSIAALKRADELIDQFGSGDIEGVGPGADARETLGGIMGYTPFGRIASIGLGEAPNAMLLSKREQKTRQIRSDIENQALHALSGAAVTESEAERLMKGLRGANNSEGMRTALDAIRTAVSEKQKNIQAGATPEAVQEYQKRGGTIVDVRRDKSQAPYVKEIK